MRIREIISFSMCACSFNYDYKCFYVPKNNHCETWTVYILVDEEKMKNEYNLHSVEK